MLEKIDVDYIDYKIDGSQTNQGIEVESDPRIELAENELSSIHNERVAEAMADVVEKYYLIYSKPENEIVGPNFIETIINRGKIVKLARLNHLSENPYKYSIKHRNPIKRSINKVRNSFYEPETERDKVNREMEISKKIFRQDLSDAEENKVVFSFFCVDEKHWFGHYDFPESTNIQSITIHYELLSNGILKCSSQDNVPNMYIYGKEAVDFERATDAYLKLMLEEYNYDAYSAQNAA